MEMPERIWATYNYGGVHYWDDFKPTLCVATEYIRADIHKARVEELEQATGGCPCKHTTPCHPYCSCRKPHLSHGCLRCATYGSPEQQRESAERLAEIIDTAYLHGKEGE